MDLEKIYGAEPTNRQRVKLFSECISDGMNVLDFGCGTGRIIGQVSEIVQLGDRSVGYDIKPDAIAKARRRFPELRFETNEVDKPLPEQDESFDAIFASEVIEHIHNTEFIFTEFRRVLRPGGLLCLTVPYHGLLKDIALLVSGKFEAHYHNPYHGHIRFYSRRSLKKVLTDYHFDILRWYGIGRIRYLWRSIFVVARRL